MTLWQHVTGINNVAIGHNVGSNYIGSESNNILIGANQLGTPGDNNIIRIGGGVGSAQTACFISGISGVNSSGGVEVFCNTSGQLGTISSSIRYKEEVKDMASYSNKIFDLRPVTFYYKNDIERIPQSGLLAEEVAPIYPDLVIFNDNGEPETVRYHFLPILLLNELQQQQKIINGMQKSIKVLESQKK
jgi:hypothetical protein